MYNKQYSSQMDIYNFILPFGGHLDPNNRWVLLSDKIDWKHIEENYANLFGDTGNPAKSARMAFGALFIKQKLNVSDEETVLQIQENAYLQYFIGFREFTTEQPFTPSLMVSFRKRFPEESLNEINEHIFLQKNNDDDDQDGTNNSSSSDTSNSEQDDVSKNQGTLIVDATCAPSDIAYPTDLELLDKARIWCEKIYDTLFKEYGIEQKKRTYRQTARHEFLSINKRRNKSKKKIRRVIRKQINYIDRDLNYIDELLLNPGAFEYLSNIQQDRLETIRIFVNQQKTMYETKSHTIDNRIVSLAQPYIRPIVRGKSKAKTEFGAKLSIAVVNGIAFVDTLSFNSYNEGEHNEFKNAVEKYRERFGMYPQRILADKIYRNRKNSQWCKEKGIRMSGPKLGRPGKHHEEDLRTELREVGERNLVESKFGIMKRKYGLNLIKAKLEETTKSDIVMNVFVMNVERVARLSLSRFIGEFSHLFKILIFSKAQ